MIGSFLTRGLVMIFGYAYPAYECYKTVEKNKPEVEQLRFWCQYWILVAVITVCERICDAFISWVPMYSEAKLAFFIYLWYPKTKGTMYVYDSFFRPYVAKHENEIDRNLLELRIRAGDMAVNYWQRAASYGQTRIFEILQYIASQSTLTPRPAQPPWHSAGTQEPGAAPNHQAPTSPNQQPAAASNRQPSSTGPSQQPAATSSLRLSTAAQPETVAPLSPISSASSSEKQEVEEEVGPSQGTKATSSVAVSGAQNTAAASDATDESLPRETQATEIEVVPSSTSENANPPPKETVMDESIRMTRGRLRRARTGGNH